MSQDSSAPEGFANSLKLACTTADTSIGSAELLTLAHIIEGQNLQTFAKGTSSAKPYAVSFYVKGNASATYVCELFDGDNSRHVAKTFSVTTDWTRVELSFPADSTDRTFFITGVQLEVGQNPTSFEHINNFGEELARCQRYFHAVSGAGHPFPIDSAYARYITHGQDSNGTRWFYEYPVEMRATPTLELNNISSSTVQHYNYNASASYNMTGSSLEESGTRHAHIRFTFASGISVGNTVSWRWLNNPNASFNFSSEL
jgi:hypothetical protein